MNKKIFRLALAGILAAMYIVLTLPFANFTFGMVQFRLAEALTVLPLLTSAAVPGVFLGCLLSNVMNPENLGLIDILGGSFTTLLAAFLTFIIGKRIRQNYFAQEQSSDLRFKQREKTNIFLALLPPVLLNGTIVGLYLPYLLIDQPTLPIILSTMLSITISQTIVIYGIGLPITLLLMKNKMVKDYLAKTN